MRLDGIDDGPLTSVSPARADSSTLSHPYASTSLHRSLSDRHRDGRLDRPGVATRKSLKTTPVRSRVAVGHQYPLLNVENDDRNRMGRQRDGRANLREREDANDVMTIWHNLLHVKELRLFQLILQNSH
jgi:hypothetical protein